MAVNIPGRASASVNRQISIAALKLFESGKAKTMKAAIKTAEKKVSAEYGVKV